MLGLVGSAGLAVQVGNVMYLPLCSKPNPTPTATPTATPLPRLMDVRIEGECSSFRGGSALDPNGEFVCLLNYDPEPVTMTGWRLEDASRHTYLFPSFLLLPGASVRVFSGPGADTATDLHWARGLVWNNDHDTVLLFDHLGRLVSRYVY